MVDDDHGTRSLLRLIFETSGHAVVEAADGRAALDVIGPNPLPDVIVTDLAMPTLDGSELIKRLHSEPRTAAIPIVVVSVNSEAALTLRASGLVDAVVSKPFDVSALVDCIGTWAITPTRTALI